MKKFWQWMKTNNHAILSAENLSTNYEKYGLVDNHSNYCAPKKQMLIGYMLEYTFTHYRFRKVDADQILTFFAKYYQIYNIEDFYKILKEHIEKMDKER